MPDEFDAPVEQATAAPGEKRLTHLPPQVLDALNTGAVVEYEVTTSATTGGGRRTRVVVEMWAHR